MGYVSRRLPALACVLLAVNAVGASPAGIRLSGWPLPPPHRHPPLDLLGCIFCNSVTLLYKAHALPHSAGLTHAPENAHLGAPAGIRPSKASRPCLCPGSSTRLGCCARWDTPLVGLPVLACVQLAVSLWVVLHPLGYVPRRPSCPCLRPASSIPLGGTSPAGIHPSGWLPVLACVLLAVSRWGCWVRCVRPSEASSTPHTLTRP